MSSEVLTVEPDVCVSVSHGKYQNVPRGSFCPA